MEFYDSRRVRARKPHACAYCGGDIPTGAEALCESGKFDGSFFRRYACPECAHHVSGFWDFCGGGPALLPDDFLDWVEDEAVPHAGLNVEVECPHCGPAGCRGETRNRTWSFARHAASRSETKGMGEIFRGRARGARRSVDLGKNEHEHHFRRHGVPCPRVPGRHQGADSGRPRLRGAHSRDKAPDGGARHDVLRHAGTSQRLRGRHT